jgi:hypothetical protein
MPAATTANTTFGVLCLSMGSRVMSGQWLNLSPVLRPLAALSRRTSDCDGFGHFPAHFSLDDFSQGNVRGPEMSDVGDERTARASTAGI